MKKRFILSGTVFYIMISLFFNPAQSQVSFERHTLDPNFDGAASVYVADINGDGHKDVLSAAAYAGEIAWYESDGTSPPEFTKHVVDDNFDDGLYVHADTINGDTLIDILGATWGGNEIALWLNDGSIPINWTKQVIDSNFHGAHEVKSANINGDEWMDVIAAGAEDHEITWWHNGGGNPIVWIKHVICSTAYGARSVYPVDIDFDGDIDLVAAAFTSDDVLLFINEGGNPVQWTEELIDGNFNGSHWVHACDIDNDDDIDVLGAGYMAKDIAIWYNDGETPIGWTKFTLDGNVPGALSVVAAHLDGDEYLDVIAAGDQAGAVIVWYQDDPVAKEFTKEIVDQTIWGAWPVHTSDLDADGDIDILSTSSTLDDIRWYENIPWATTVDEPLGYQPGIRVDQNYPNPFRHETTIQYYLPEDSGVNVEIYSIYGSLIRSLFTGHHLTGSHTLRWNGKDEDGNPVSSGVYICRITTPETTVCSRIVKEH